MDFSTTNEIYVNKLPVDNYVMYILTDWSTDDIGIKIFISNKAFHNKLSGVISRDILDISAKDLSMGYSEFKEECKSALITNMGKESFIYLLEDNIFKLQKCKRFKITYFEVQLDECIEDLEKKILNFSIDITEKQFRVIKEKNEEINHLKSEIANLVVVFEKCKSEKKSLETSLFTKFALLLNSKKKRIKKLENILEKEGIGLTYSSKQKDNEKPVTNGSGHNMETDIFENNINNLDDFDAETQVMTPEESKNLNVLNLPKRTKVLRENIPSTSVKSFFKDSESFLGERFELRKEIPESRKSSALSEENSSEEFFRQM